LSSASEFHLKAQSEYCSPQGLSDSSDRAIDLPAASSQTPHVQLSLIDQPAPLSSSLHSTINPSEIYLPLLDKELSSALDSTPS
jgi:hypothetical protein